MDNSGVRPSQVTIMEQAASAARAVLYCEGVGRLPMHESRAQLLALIGQIGWEEFIAVTASCARLYANVRPASLPPLPQEAVGYLHKFSSACDSWGAALMREVDRMSQSDYKP